MLVLISHPSFLIPHFSSLNTLWPLSNPLPSPSHTYTHTHTHSAIIAIARLSNATITQARSRTLLSSALSSSLSFGAAVSDLSLAYYDQGVVACLIRILKVKICCYLCFLRFLLFYLHLPDLFLFFIIFSILIFTFHFLSLTFFLHSCLTFSSYTSS